MADHRRRRGDEAHGDEEHDKDREQDEKCFDLQVHRYFSIFFIANRYLQ